MTAHSCFLITNTHTIIICGIRKKAVADAALTTSQQQTIRENAWLRFNLQAVSTNGNMVLTQREDYMQ